MAVVALGLLTSGALCFLLGLWGSWGVYAPGPEQAMTWRSVLIQAERNTTALCAKAAIAVVHC